MLSMLLPDFRWSSVGTAAFDQRNSLLLDSTEMLLLHRRVGDGTWWVSLNNQRDSYAQGKAGAELWTERHQGRLRAEVDQRIKRLGIGKPFLMR